MKTIILAIGLISSVSAFAYDCSIYTYDAGDQLIPQKKLIDFQEIKGASADECIAKAKDIFKKNSASRVSRIKTGFDITESLNDSNLVLKGTLKNY